MANSSQLGNSQLGNSNLGGGGLGPTPPSMDVVQNTTMPSVGAFIAGGVVTLGLAVVGASPIPSVGAFPAGGVVALTPSGARVTEAYAEVYSSPLTSGRVTEAFGEVFFSPPSTGRVTEAFLEVFYSYVAPPPVQGTTSGGGHKKPHYPKPNVYDCCLWNEAEVWRRVKLKKYECPTLEDWDGRTVPALGEEFWVTGTILTPAIITGDFLVVQFQPGPGEEGLLYGIVFWYTGTGFVPGSGDILWRLKVGRAWVKDRGAVNVTQGSPGGPWPIQDYIPIGQGQIVSAWVSVPNLSGAIQVGTSNIVCSLQGWTWPVG